MKFIFQRSCQLKVSIKIKGEIDFALGSVRYFLWLVRAEGRKLGSYRILLTKGGLEPASSYSWVLGLDLWLHCDSRNVSHIRKSPASTWQITPDTVFFSTKVFVILSENYFSEKYDNEKELIKYLKRDSLFIALCVWRSDSNHVYWASWLAV